MVGVGDRETNPIPYPSKSSNCNIYSTTPKNPMQSSYTSANQAIDFLHDVLGQATTLLLNHCREHVTTRSDRERVAAAFSEWSESMVQELHILFQLDPPEPITPTNPTNPTNPTSEKIPDGRVFIDPDTLYGAEGEVSPVSPVQNTNNDQTT